MSVRCLPSPVRAKPRGAVVGADRDADSHVEGEWSVGEDLEHPPAAEVLRLLGAGDVAGDGLHGTLRQARHGAGAGRDQRRSGEARHLGERAARDRQDPRPVIATRWPELFGAVLADRRTAGGSDLVWPSTRSEINAAVPQCVGAGLAVEAVAAGPDRSGRPRRRCDRVSMLVRLSSP